MACILSPMRRALFTERAVLPPPSHSRPLKNLFPMLGGLLATECVCMWGGMQKERDSTKRKGGHPCMRGFISVCTGDLWMHGKYSRPHLLHGISLDFQAKSCSKSAWSYPKSALPLAVLLHHWQRWKGRGTCRRTIGGGPHPDLHAGPALPLTVTNGSYTCNDGDLSQI